MKTAGMRANPGCSYRLLPSIGRSPKHPRSPKGFIRRASKRTTIVFALFVLALGVLQIAPTSANEAAFRDLDTAQRLLREAHDELQATDSALGRARDALRASHIEREFLTGSDADRLELLETWGRRSRQLAVEAYIGGADVGAQVYLIDTEYAADLTYQGVLLQEHAQTAIGASLAYASLIDSSDKVLVDLADEIDMQWRRIESLENDLDNAGRRVADAEWVVQIAQIHDLADGEFEARQRREPTPLQWHELRMCESTNNYAVNTGNGFYGAYQFDYNTWFTVGGETGTYAWEAPPEEQDARARLLFSRRGSQPWPVCGRFLNG